MKKTYSQSNVRNVVRVLLVDDNPERIQTALSLLEKNENLKFQTVCTTSVISIRKKIEKREIDIILLSLALSEPKMKPIMQLIDSECPIPCIVLASSRRDSRSITAAGKHHYLVRSSLDSKLLANTIKSAIERKVTHQLSQHIKEFQDSEARFLNIILQTADGIVITNKSNNVLFVNPAAQLMLGFENNLGKHELPFDINCGESKEVSVGVKGSNRKTLEVRASETTWETKPALLISLRDVTSRKSAEDTLKKSEERYALAIKGSKDGLWDWDLRTDKIYFGQQWKSMLGYSEEQIGDSPQEWFSRIHRSDVNRVKKAVESHIKGETTHFECEFRLAHKNDSFISILARGTAIRNNNGKAVRFAGSQTDITERSKAEKELKKALNDLRFALASEKVLMEELDKKNKELVELSITDGLTGLYNHRFLQERFDFEFKRVLRYGGHLSCMILDIDHFKHVNDTYGHQFGDLVIRQISTILKTRSREVDICGRYGGEEFMILSSLRAEDALRFASKLHKSIEDHEFVGPKNTIHVTVSIGIAEFRTDVKTKQELLERSDTALYQAKKDGRNLIRVWKEMEKVDEKIIDRLGIQDLKTKFEDLSDQMRVTYMDSCNAFVMAVDAKDPFAREHSHNVSKYSVALAKHLNLPVVEVEVIRYAALLHDVGKIGIQQDILTKKERLTPKEFDILQRHPVVGVNILKEVKFLEKELPIILYHHERFDGKGYPQGLKGREIPLGARIISVADAYDAMTAGRTYRERLTKKQALNEIKKGSGTQFEPELVLAFVEVFEKGQI